MFAYDRRGQELGDRRVMATVNGNEGIQFPRLRLWWSVSLSTTKSVPVAVPGVARCHSLLSAHAPQIVLAAVVP